MPTGIAAVTDQPTGEACLINYAALVAEDALNVVATVSTAASVIL
jgi:hypothetical protein